MTCRVIFKFTAALFDLEEALKLSNKTGRTGCRAFCQRGLLKRKNENDDGAREDFNEAAKLGSQFARKQVCLFLKIPFLLTFCYNCFGMYSWLN